MNDSLGTVKITASIDISSVDQDIKTLEKRLASIGQGVNVPVNFMTENVVKITQDLQQALSSLSGTMAPNAGWGRFFNELKSLQVSNVKIPPIFEYEITKLGTVLQKFSDKVQGFPTAVSTFLNAVSKLGQTRINIAAFDIDMNRLLLVLNKFTTKVRDVPKSVTDFIRAFKSLQSLETSDEAIGRIQRSLDSFLTSLQNFMNNVQDMPEGLIQFIRAFQKIHQIKVPQIPENFTASLEHMGEGLRKLSGININENISDVIREIGRAFNMNFSITPTFTRDVELFATGIAQLQGLNIPSGLEISKVIEALSQASKISVPQTIVEDVKLFAVALGVLRKELMAQDIPITTIKDLSIALAELSRQARRAKADKNAFASGMTTFKGAFRASTIQLRNMGMGIGLLASDFSSLRGLVNSLTGMMFILSDSLLITDERIQTIINSSKGAITTTEQATQVLRQQNMAQIATIGKWIAVSFAVSSVISAIERFNQRIQGYADSIANVAVSAGNAFLNMARTIYEAATSRTRQALTTFAERISNILYEVVSLSGNFRRLISIMQGISSVAFHALSLRNNLRRLGRIVSVTARRMNQLWRSSFAFENLSDGLSDVIGVIRVWAGANEELNQSMAQIRVNFLTAFYEPIQIIMPVLLQFMNVMARLTAYFAHFVSMLFGSVYLASREGARGIWEMAEAIEGAGDEARKQLAPFDELVVLTDNAGGAETPAWDWDFEPPEFPEWLEELADLLEDILEDTRLPEWFDMGTRAAERFTDMLNRIPWDDIRRWLRNLGQNLAAFLGGLLSNVELWEALGRTLAQAINSIAELIYGFSSRFPWAAVGYAIGRGINAFVEALDMEVIANAINYTLRGILDLLIALVETINWNRIGYRIAELLNLIDWVGIFGRLGTFAAALINGIAEAVYYFATNFNWDVLGLGIATGLNNFFERWDAGLTARAFSRFATGLLDAMLEAIRLLHWTIIGYRIGEFLNSIDWVGILGRIGTFAGSILTGVSQSLYIAARNFNWDTLGEALAASINNFFASWNMGLTGSTLSRIANGFLQSIIEAIRLIDGDLIGQRIAEFLNNINFGRFAGNMSIAIVGLAQLITDVLQRATNDIQWDGIGRSIADGLNELFNIRKFGNLAVSIGELVTGILDMFASFIQRFDFIQAAHAVRAFIRGFLESVSPEDVADVINNLVRDIVEFFNRIPVDEIRDWAVRLIQAIDWQAMLQMIGQINEIRALPSEIVDMMVRELRNATIMNFLRDNWIWLISGAIAAVTVGGALLKSITGLVGWIMGKIAAQFAAGKAAASISGGLTTVFTTAFAGLKTGKVGSAITGFTSFLGSKLGTGTATASGKAVKGLSGLKTGLMALGPKGWAITGVVAGVGVLTTALLSTNEATRNARQHTDELAEATGLLIERNVRLSESFNSSLAGIQVARDRMEELSTSIFNVAEQSSRTPAELNAMQAEIDELNRLVPNLKLAFDETTGALNRSETAIASFIERATLMSSVEETTRRLNEVNTEAANIQMQIADNEAQIAAIQEITGRGWLDRRNQIRDLNEANEQLIQTYGVLRSEEEGLNALRDEKLANLERLQQAQDQYIEALAQVEYALQRQQQALDQINHAYLLHSDEVVRSLNRIVEASDGTVESVIEGIQRQIEAMRYEIEARRNWEQNIYELNRRMADGTYGITQEIIDMFNEMGYNSASALDQLLNDTEGVLLTELVGVIDEFNEVSLERFVQGQDKTTAAMAVATGQLPHYMAQALADNFGVTIEQFMALGKEMYNEAREFHEKSYTELGRITSESMGQGIDEGAPNTVERARGFGQRVLAAIRGIFGINSPSTVMIGYGKNLANSLGEGMAQQEASALSRAANVARNVLSSIREVFGINSPSTEMIYLGENLVESLGDGVEQQGAYETYRKFDEIWYGIQEVFYETDIWFGEKFLYAAEMSIEAFEPIIEYLTEIWEAIVEVYDVVPEYFDELFSEAWENIQEAWSEVIQWFTEKWDSIDEIFSVAPEFFQDMFSQSWENVVAIWDVAPSYFQAIWDAIVAVFDSAEPRFFAIGQHIMQGLSAGISAMTPAIMAQVEAIASAIEARLRAALAVRSPSRVAMYIGEMVSLGLAEGILDGASYAIDATDDLAEGVISSMYDISSEDVSIGESLFKGFESYYDKIVGFINGIADTMREKLALQMDITVPTIDIPTLSSRGVVPYEVVYAMSSRGNNAYAKDEDRNYKQDLALIREELNTLTTVFVDTINAISSRPIRVNINQKEIATAVSDRYASDHVRIGNR